MAVPDEVPPVTIPVGDIPATVVAGKMLQVPPAVASVSAIVKPSHTVDGPLMAEGSESTVTT
jgi:hypothetical protein